MQNPSKWMGSEFFGADSYPDDCVRFGRYIARLADYIRETKLRERDAGDMVIFDNESSNTRYP